MSWTAPDFEHAYRGIVSLVSVASLAGALSTTREALRLQPNAAELQKAIGEFRTNRWLDYESGRWAPPPVVPAEIQNAGKKFFGDR